MIRRFLRGSPVLAILLSANLGAIGLIAVVEVGLKQKEAAGMSCRFFITGAVCKGPTRQEGAGAEGDLPGRASPANPVQVVPN